MSEQCNAKAALLLEYTNLTKTYCELVNELHLNMGTISRADYHHQYGQAEEVRLHAEKARVVMELHVIDHRC